MKLFLARHGAVDSGAGGDPPLSAKGRGDVQRLAAFLGQGGIRVQRVLHSPLKRARETALLLAAGIGPASPVEEIAEGLLPEDSTDAIADALAGWDGDTLLVGHMPHLGHLASRLLTGAERSAAIAFERGAVACFERVDAGWILLWSVGPGLIGR